MGRFRSRRSGGPQSQAPAAPPPVPADSPGEVETEFDTFSRRCGVVKGSNGVDWRVEITFQDCVEESCSRCYEPLWVSIESEDAHGPVSLQLDVAEDWLALDELMVALREARRRPRC